MRKVFYFAVCFLLVAASFTPPRQYYVDLPYEGHAQLRQFADNGFDIGGIDHDKKTLSLIVQERDLTRLQNFRVLSKRVIPRAPDQDFKDPQEIEDALKAAAANYPHLVDLEVIGQSLDGRDIYAAHITARFFEPTPGKTKPAVLFDSMHHAREIMTPEVALDIVDYLTKNYGKDSKVTQWVDDYSIWVVPMVNPDGNEKVWSADPMWRKNTRGGYGVDINRNYSHAWNTCKGSSGNKTSQTYRGPKPASEPETQNLMKLADRIKPVFNISYHSYSEMVLYPFGCRPDRIPQPDRAVYEKVGRELAAVLVKDTGNPGYRVGTAYELLYNVDGGSLDWMYAQHKIMSFVIEVNSTQQGFQPSYSKWRDITVKRQRAGWMYILDRMSGTGIRP